MKTALVLAAIANSTFDQVHCGHPFKLCLWLDAIACLAADNTLDYLSFEKEISSKYVMNHDETLSTSENELLDTRGDKKTEEHKSKSRLGGVQSTYSDKVVQEDGEVRVPRDLQIRGDRIWSDRFRETAGS